MSTSPSTIPQIPGKEDKLWSLGPFYKLCSGYRAYMRKLNLSVSFLLGRCWIFSCLNVMRLPFMKKFNIEEFEFSQSYLFFWDKVSLDFGKFVLYNPKSALLNTSISVSITVVKLWPLLIIIVQSEVTVK